MIGILAFTEAGRNLAQKVMESCGDRWEFQTRNKDEKAADFVADHFREFDGFLFIGAVGICIRMIAPHIQSKDVDPAVMVMDEKGQYVIPVLSGHIGGGNRLALELAEAMGATPVITTATDLNEKFAADVWATEQGCRIQDISQIRYISGAILEGKKAAFRSDFPWSGTLPAELTEEDAECGILVSLEGGRQPFSHTLNVVPQIVTLGVGCRRDTDPEAFERFVLDKMSEAGISLKAVEQVTSIDIKKEERCILEFCAKYHLPFITYTAEELMAVEGEFDHSDFVEKTTGADNICERSAAAASGGHIIIKKTAGGGMTLAACERKWECKF